LPSTAAVEHPTRGGRRKGVEFCPQRFAVVAAREQVAALQAETRVGWHPGLGTVD
jgi:hypothetical protein